MKICRYHNIEFDADECPLCVVEQDETAINKKWNISESFDLALGAELCLDRERSCE